MKKTFFEELYLAFKCQSNDDLINIIEHGFHPSHKPAKDFLLPFARKPNENNYSISDNLGTALERCSIDIPSECLKGDRELYIRFPDFISDDWRGAFCTVKGNIFSILLAGHFDVEATMFSRLSYSITAHPSLNTLLNDVKDPRFDDECVKAAIFAAKCLLYIKTGSPDLRIFKAPELPTTRKEKKIRFFLRNNPLFDSVIVGLDYLKPVNYSKDQTTIQGHFRWQRVGKLLSDIKLTWVTEHQRKFNKILEAA